MTNRSGDLRGEWGRGGGDPLPPKATKGLLWAKIFWIKKGDALSFKIWIRNLHLNMDSQFTFKIWIGILHLKYGYAQ